MKYFLFLYVLINFSQKGNTQSSSSEISTDSRAQKSTAQASTNGPSTIQTTFMSSTLSSRTLTTNIVTPESTPVSVTHRSKESFTVDYPSQDGEYSTTANMIISFLNRTYIPQFDNLSSPETLNFFDEFYQKIKPGLQFYNIRIVSVIINNIKNGSVIVDCKLDLAINLVMDNKTLKVAFTNVTFSVYNDTVNVKEYDKEDVSKVRAQCPFINEEYQDDYKISSSAGFISYRNKEYQKWKVTPLLKPIDLNFYSLLPGSIVTDMKLKIISIASIANKDSQVLETFSRQSANNGSKEIASNRFGTIS